MATQTLLDLYLTDNTIINIPVNGLPQGIDRDLVKSYILDACGECVPRYQTVEKYKVMNDLFYRTHQKEFEHLLKVVNADYSPIENTDRYTSISDSTSEDESGTNSKTTSQTTSSERDDSTNVTGSTTNGNTQTHENGIEDTVVESTTTAGTDALSHNTTRATTDSKTETQGTTVSTTAEHQVSAENVATYSPETKDITSTTNGGSNSTQGTGSETLTGTDTTTTSGSEDRTITTSHDGTETVTDQGQTSTTGSTTNHSENSGSLSGTEQGQDTREKTITYEHTEHTHGNIGVTTNSAMLTDEVNEVIMSGIINIYKMISVMYDSYMMIGVY